MNKRICFLNSGFALISVLSFILGSCTDFLTSIDKPIDQLEASTLFNDDITANAAVLGIYSNLLNQNAGFARGDNTGLSALTGLSADELTNHSTASGSGQFAEFEQNSLRAINIYVLSLWSSMYKTIYLCNSAIEGLNKSTNTSLEIRQQLLGEVMFVRAFTYFQIVNLFGDAPLIISTNYEANAGMSRTPVDAIYEQIVSDLVKAQEVLSDNYPSLDNERVRANKLSATALLARVYLFQGKWAMAEAQSSIVIGKPIYQLNDNLDDVFLKNSTESILQLRPNVNPDAAKGYTYEGLYFSLSFTPTNNSLREDFVNSFDPLDKRRNSWISQFQYGSETLFRPTKYKVYDYNAPLTEYSMVLRLAEQYLIRSEARAQQNNLVSAIDDLNIVRRRAGLLDIKAIPSQDEVLSLIVSERRCELFTEWGHRWFDLKRTGRSLQTLGAIKTAFGENKLLYPIPQTERSKNVELTQNPGY